MYCNNCGAFSPDGAKFCANCGFVLVPTINVTASEPDALKTNPILDMTQPVAPMYTPIPETAPEVPAAYGDPGSDGQSAYTDPQGGYDAYGQSPVVPDSLADAVFTHGLLGLIFACTGFLSFLGIVFGAIARNKAGQLTETYGYQPERAQTGRILGTIGMILGIALTALAFLVIMALLLFIIFVASY